MVAPQPEAVTTGIEEAAGVLTDALRTWYEGLRDANGRVNTNVMCAGLYVTEFFAEHYPLEPEHYLAPSQVKTAGGSQAHKLLAQHGETRSFTREGGRTSRATISHARAIAALLNEQGPEAGVDDCSAAERAVLASLLQAWFVGRVQEDHFGRKRIEAEINPDNPVRTSVAALIEAGRQRGGNTAGAIVQHLVGAKLALRFPGEDVNIESYTTADVQTGRAGDYQIGDTAIHVTMSPGEKVFKERCAHNLRHGYRPWVLVPDNRVVGATQIAQDLGMADRVAIQSIEDFVGTNIEEMASFGKAAVRDGMRRLLTEYNFRIDQAEADKSLKIQIPENL
ncbi:hypothetical protein GCM10010387_13710 [Streptomyces inusitatus]|uniref:DUF4928 domain-containing protein n=1 Tax=Streptomyces inusitatus TaxID=68221 RepID=A0A918PUM7_9ACTN|nr:DUF4928 family protein [Streptomyces inusitatus]GGZ21838.1 hypothetical protein GCM10010387_13710 [Streptomyces inusitatus]